MEVVEALRKTQEWFGKLGIVSARLDAELLLGHVLSLPRLALYTSFDRPLDRAETDAFRELVRRRAKREPIAYLLGEQEFYGRPFTVDSRVLIPRPDTETLVEVTLKALPVDADGVVLDYGTGSGAIAVTLAAERPKLRVLGLDLSADALEVAKLNVTRNGVADRVGLVRSDGLSRTPERFRGTVAGVVANPPYIPEQDRAGLMPDVRDFEPASALFAGPDPLLHYRRLTENAGKWLAPGGFLAVEVGAGQAADVSLLFADAGWADISVTADLGAIDRVVFGVRPAR